ncbi:unnamed protein product [Ectocarpus sp. CCAP 1310/34]|nr:unnamed protein product [Ectocarpus sp. CCAP 1310/34]
MLSMYPVDLSGEEARCLYQQLDSDRDGALGAEDLLRGASTVASFFANRQRISKDKAGRQREGQKSTLARLAERNATLQNDEPMSTQIRSRGGRSSEWRRNNHVESRYPFGG